MLNEINIIILVFLSGLEYKDMLQVISNYHIVKKQSLFKFALYLNIQNMICAEKKLYIS
jgi:hypothetical protein